MERVLFSPVGDTDPVRGCCDGACLHIVRHYRPTRVILFYTQEMEEKERHDHRYTRAIERIAPDCTIENIFSGIRDAHLYESFGQVLPQHIGILAEIMPPKFSPCQSFLPGSGIGRVTSDRPHLAHRQRTEHQMRRELRAAVLGGQAAQHGVIRQARQKLGQLPPGGSFAAGNGEHGAGDVRQRGGFQIFR